MDRRRATAVAAFAALVATVWAANWALDTWGVIPIGFGLEAPAGVLFAGLAFGLRDVLHDSGGVRWVLAAIGVGTALSYVLSDAAAIPGGVTTIAVASGVAFLFSELGDLLVYSPMRERHWPAAVVASNLVGAVLDSALFLWLAFGSQEFFWGQVVGKAWMVGLSLPLVWVARRQLRPA